MATNTKEYRRRYRKTPKGRFNRNKNKFKYKITFDEYNALKASQSGLCALCSQPNDLFLDHCHATGKIRGFLCRNCNVGLGLFNDNTELLLKAINYLK